MPVTTEDNSDTEEDIYCVGLLRECKGITDMTLQQQMDAITSWLNLNYGGYGYYIRFSKPTEDLLKDKRFWENDYPVVICIDLAVFKGRTKLLNTLENLVRDNKLQLISIADFDTAEAADLLTKMFDGAKRKYKIK